MKNKPAGLNGLATSKREREGNNGNHPILEARNISMSFGRLAVLKKVSFSVRPGNIVVIIGPNGAGKSTLLKLISRLLPLREGEIWYKQQRIDKIAPHRIASLGITQVFQDIQIFSNMSVIENVMVGCHLQSKSGFLSAGLKLSRAEAEEQAILQTAMSKLALVGLEDKAFASPGSLSWGQLKLVGVARALATGSELLLLDEPYGGLLADEIERLNHLILELQSQGITILIVEHLTDIIMGVTNQIIVLDYGEKIADGTPAEIKNNKKVTDVYFGSEQLESEEGL